MPSFADRVTLVKITRWLAAPMKKSMGMDSIVFVRDAKPAR